MVVWEIRKMLGIFLSFFRVRKTVRVTRQKHLIDWVTFFGIKPALFVANKLFSDFKFYQDYGFQLIQFILR